MWNHMTFRWTDFPEFEEKRSLALAQAFSDLYRHNHHQSQACLTCSRTNVSSLTSNVGIIFLVNSFW